VNLTIFLKRSLEGFGVLENEILEMRVIGEIHGVLRRRRSLRREGGGFSRGLGVSGGRSYK
jgi:hypothetical protein